MFHFDETCDVFIPDVLKILVVFERVFAPSFVQSVVLSFDFCMEKGSFVKVGQVGQFVVPRPFHFISLVNRVGFNFISRASWGPRGPPVQKSENRNTPVEVCSFKSKSFVPCAGRTAGPLFHEWASQTAPLLGRSDSFSFFILGNGGGLL